MRSVSLIKECIVRRASEDVNNERGSHSFEGNWTSRPWLTASAERCVWGGVGVIRGDETYKERKKERKERHGRGGGGHSPTA